MRFAKRELTTKVDPIQGYTELTPTADRRRAPAPCASRWTTPWDRDNEKLKVEVLRGATTATSTVIKTFTTGAPRGGTGRCWASSTPRRRPGRARPTGSGSPTRSATAVAGPPTTVTIPAGTPTASNYSARVLADNPSSHWRIGERAARPQLDRAGSNDLTLNAHGLPQPVAARSPARPTTPSTSPAARAPRTVQGATPFWGSGPQTFSLEAWVKTNTHQRRQDHRLRRQPHRPEQHRRHRPPHLHEQHRAASTSACVPTWAPASRSTARRPTATTSGTTSSATLGADGMKLYVDGNQVAQQRRRHQGAGVPRLLAGRRRPARLVAVRPVP